MAAFRLFALKGRFHRILNVGLRFQSSIQSASKEAEKSAEGTFKLWKRVSLFVAIPATLAIGYKALFVDHEEHPDPDRYIPYSYLRIRNKAFPWGDGDHTLFHNDHFNLGFEKIEAQEEPEQVEPEEKVPWITKFIEDYLMEDPEESRKFRNDHMRLIRERQKEFLEKKRKKQLPQVVMDLEAISKDVVRPPEFTVDGY